MTNHPTAGEVPAGMKPWAGGDAAPDDWAGPGSRALGRLGQELNPGAGPIYWRHASDDDRSDPDLDIIAYTPVRPTPAPVGADAMREGQDRKFAFRDGQFVNRVSGEPIPIDEPIIIFRARDHHALPVLRFYRTLASDPHHQQAIQDRIDEFTAYRAAHPERMKEPGITRHIELNAALTSLQSGER